MEWNGSLEVVIWLALHDANIMFKHLVSSGSSKKMNKGDKTARTL